MNEWITSWCLSCNHSQCVHPLRSLMSDAMHILFFFSLQFFQRREYFIIFRIKNTLLFYPLLWIDIVRLQSLYGVCSLFISMFILLQNVAFLWSIIFYLVLCDFFFTITITNSCSCWVLVYKTTIFCFIREILFTDYYYYVFLICFYFLIGHSLCKMLHK